MIADTLYLMLTVQLFVLGWHNLQLSCDVHEACVLLTRFVAPPLVIRSLCNQQTPKIVGLISQTCDLRVQARLSRACPKPLSINIHK